MASLFTYQKMVERLCRDQRQQGLNPDDIRDYINRARREVAMRSRCVRVLPPISGQIIGASVTSPGSGYTAPTVVISPPDFPSGYPPTPNGQQATATATVTGGSITAVSIAFGGYGYYQPSIAITDPVGTGATVVPQMSFINQFTAGQESYPLSAINLSMFPGVASVFDVWSISVLYSNYRYSMILPSFSTYQALLRNFPLQFQYVPFFAAKFGMGTGTQIFFYPLPSQSYQIEMDCICLPSDLTDDQSYDVIPDPYTDLVPFLSCYYGFLDLQNPNMARFYKSEFEDWAKKYGTYVRPGQVMNRYGRTVP